jgi:hypothetical protein
MGFARQLTSEEIFEQVSRFSAELAQEDKRVTNVVFMGMVSKKRMACMCATEIFVITSSITGDRLT